MVGTYKDPSLVLRSAAAQLARCKAECRTLKEKNRHLTEGLLMARSVIVECRKFIPTSPHDDGVPVEWFIDQALEEGV
jgi:hypothetical protein